MSESQQGNQTRCPSVYCLNSDSVFYDVSFAVADTQGGVWITGESRIPRGARVKIANEASVSRTVRVVGTSYQATMAAGSEAFIALTDGNLDPWLGEIGAHELELVDEPEAARFAVTVYHPGALDFSQSSIATAKHGGGCCRTSIALTGTSIFSGFPGHNGGYGTRYLTRTVTEEYYGFTSGGCSVVFAGVNELSPVTFPGVRYRLRQRFRSKRFLIRARDEIILEQESGGTYSPDDSGYIRFFREDLPRLEAWPAFEGDTECNGVRAYFIASGPTEIVSDTVQVTQLLWMWGGLNSDGVITEPFIADGVAGLLTVELSSPVTIGDVLDDIQQAMDFGTRWWNVEYPYTKLGARWFDFDESSQTAKVASTGCRLDNGSETQVDIVDGSGPAWSSDWIFGQASDLVWPPATGAAWCDEALTCAGQINSPAPPDYRCVFEDIGNSLNGLLPANANLAQTITPGQTLSDQMFSLDSVTNPLRNPCATKQNLAAGLSNDPEDPDPAALCVISPALHHLASIRMEAKEYGIVVERTMVKHIWGAPFCRTVTEVRESAETTLEVLKCEANLTGIRHDSTAPCAWVDDPARSVERLDPGADDLTTYDVADWPGQMVLGDVFARVVEMGCPNLETPENPCGCNP